MEHLSLFDKASNIRMLVLDVDGTLTDGGVYIDSNGLQSRKFNIRDGMGIKLLQDSGISVGLISHSSVETILQERAKMLSISKVYAGKMPKLQVFHQWMSELSLSANEIAYMGDDVNDLEIILEAGLTACPADAHYKVVQAVDIVLQRKGGEGCVREFIDRYLLSGI